MYMLKTNLHEEATINLKCNLKTNIHEKETANIYVCHTIGKLIESPTKMSAERGITGISVIAYSLYTKSVNRISKCRVR